MEERHFQTTLREETRGKASSIAKDLLLSFFFTKICIINFSISMACNNKDRGERFRENPKPPHQKSICLTKSLCLSQANLLTQS